MTLYETQDRPWNGPGLSPVERKLATYLGMEVVNVRRRSEKLFDVEVDYIEPDLGGITGWLPLVLLHLEWKLRPIEIGGLVEAAGGRAAEDCAKDWDYVRDLDDDDKFMAMCYAIWHLAQLRLGAFDNAAGPPPAAG